MMCEFNIPFSTTGESEEYPTYQIIGDNVDLHQRASYQTMDLRDSDHHWFHLYAVKDRVTGIGLPNDSPMRDISQLPLHTFLPSVKDCNFLRNEFGIARVITRISILAKMLL